MSAAIFATALVAFTAWVFFDESGSFLGFALSPALVVAALFCHALGLRRGPLRAGLLTLYALLFLPLTFGAVIINGMAESGG